MIEDLIKSKAIKRDLSNLKGLKANLKRSATTIQFVLWCEIASLADRMVKEKYYNVSMTTILENFLLNILEVKYICR